MPYTATNGRIIRQRPAITKHLNNVFKSEELSEKVVGSILEHTTQCGAIKGKTQAIKVNITVSMQLCL
ncbi:hypothetical protein [Arachidicoccus sp.]|uniref:hypothetical protein n=1 Tax=Arachidicoccus sp. TaxID=1872624 RepID=UPI003D259EB6